MNFLVYGSEVWERSGIVNDRRRYSLLGALGMKWFRKGRSGSQSSMDPVGRRDRGSDVSFSISGTGVISVSSADLVNSHSGKEQLEVVRRLSRKH